MEHPDGRMRAYQVRICADAFLKTFIDVEAPNRRQASKVLDDPEREEELAAAAVTNSDCQFETLLPHDVDVDDVTDEIEDLAEAEWPPEFVEPDHRY